MKKVFNIFMILVMVLGIGISIVNFTSTNLSAEGTIGFWRYGTHSGGMGEDWSCIGTFTDCAEYIQIYFPK